MELCIVWLLKQLQNKYDFSERRSYKWNIISRDNGCPLNATKTQQNDIV